MVFQDIFCITRFSPLIFVFYLILYVIDFGIIIFCIGQGFKYIYTNNKLQTFHKRSYWSNITTFGIFLASLSLSGFACRTRNNSIVGICFFFILFFAFAAQISILYGLVGRVYFTFKGSSYGISEKQFFILKVHCIAILCVALLSFISLLIDELYAYDNINIKPFEFRFFAAVLLVISIIYYWIVYCKCVLLFTSKIMQIVVCSMNSVRDINKINSININSKQEKFLGTITKHFVLASVKLTLTVICATIIIITVIFVFSSTLSDTKTDSERLRAGMTGFVVLASVALIDVGVTLLNMYMHYQFANSVYLKLCGKCHAAAKKKWDKRAGNKMTERVLSLSERDKQISIGSQSNTSEIIMSQNEKGITS